jgi:small subunit ribosomal protein S2
MSRTNFDALLDAGVHFGHLRRKWNPAMAPYIFMERNGIHIIDLYKTMAKIDEAASALKQIAKSGKKVLFVATKKQAKEIVAEHIKRINMPYVTERWPGGMLTNFATIRKAVRKMISIDKLMSSPSYTNLSKKERLTITRERAKLEKNLGSIADLNRLPAAIFIVDILKEHIALAEAKKLNIPTFAIVDTNSDPRTVDFPIPANDDASKSISLIVDTMVRAIEEGLVERKLDRDKKEASDEHGEGEEGEGRIGLSMLDSDEDEVDEDGIKIVKKDFVDTKVAKMKAMEPAPEDKNKPARKRISKPAGRSNKK